LSTATDIQSKQEPMPLKRLLEKSADRLAAVLPKHLTSERFIQVVSTLVYRTPKLQECVPTTILTAVLEACELGLDLSPRLGEAYLIPRWNNKAKCLECQFQPGYQGLVKLARQSGAVTYISSRLVHDGDEFSLEFTPDLAFHHRPRLGQARGAVVHVYAVAKLTTGEHLIEVMTVDEIEAIRKRSQSPDSGPWATDWGEMARKTVLRRLCKSLPRSAELARALDADYAEYDQEGTRSPATVVTSHHQRQLPGESRTSALARRLTATEEEPVYQEGTAGMIVTEDEETEEREPGSDG
jgi:recombination protein RecT